VTDDTPAAERWLPVVGWEGLYEVSDLGRVRSLDRVTTNKNGVDRRFPGRVLKLYDNKRLGRLELGLNRGGAKGGIHVRARVHILVLTAFVGPRPDGMEGCHGPAGGYDNRLTNLRWDTHSENMLDRTRHGTCHHRKRTRCNFGHRLVPPNVTNWYTERGWRRCKACHRARANRYYANKRGHLFNFQAAADRHYAEIMAAA
jgi:hypothetical protein